MIARGISYIYILTLKKFNNVSRQSFIKTPLSALILLMLANFSHSHAQEVAPQESFWEKVRFGGSAGLSLNNDFFNVSLSPKAVYDFSSKVSAGIGAQGSYTNGPNYNAYTAGGGLLGLYRPIPSLQLSTEFEELFVSRERYLDGGNTNVSYWYPALFFGLGYNTGPVTIGVRYDVLYDENRSIYGNALLPFVSIYF